MDVISVTNARVELFNLIKDVNETHKPVQIVNKSGNAAVLLSLEDWSAIEEMIYLNGVPGLADNLISGLKENIDDMPNAKDLEW